MRFTEVQALFGGPPDHDSWDDIVGGQPDAPLRDRLTKRRHTVWLGEGVAAEVFFDELSRVLRTSFRTGTTMWKWPDPSPSPLERIRAWFGW
jgi:hypothetical protein